jgi:hypothetical protein
VTDLGEVTDWLLDSDPSRGWQVLRDLLVAGDAEWAAERAKIETVGWGAQLLALQGEDGQWAGGAFMPAGFKGEDWKRLGQPWTATCFSLTQLREFGLEPGTERARRMVELIGRNSHWDHAGQPFWEGEVEECINGRTVADGAYFGVDVSPIVARLLGERQEDGGWNCERANGSVRSSFHSTINVLEGLLEYEIATGGSAETRAARRSGERYLLERGLFKRLTTGTPADNQFLTFHHPNRWHYDVLRGLDYFRSAGLFDAVDPDPRLAEAIEYVRSRRLSDGVWHLDCTPRGPVWFEVDAGPGQPSKWVTLRALRVLKWWDEREIPSPGREKEGPAP